jgi:putative FmdB family regulatory protein
MPLYEYRCPTCRSTFELLRPMSGAEQRATCPSGHGGATRVISLVAARAWDGAPVPGAAASGGGCACGGGSCGCGAR